MSCKRSQKRHKVKSRKKSSKKSRKNDGKNDGKKMENLSYLLLGALAGKYINKKNYTKHISPRVQKLITYLEKSQ